MFLSKTVFSWYIQGAFYPRLYIEGCQFGQQYTMFESVYLSNTVHAPTMV